MKKIYNKLIRDKIPEIIEADGGSCKTRVLKEDEYLTELDKKLSEELSEYLESGSVEELADLYEVIRSVAVARGYSTEELEKVRAEKAAQRGGFEKKLLLLEVEK